MLAGRHDNPEPGACLHIDMRKNAALADKFQARQPFQQRSPDLGPLPDQHQNLNLRQPCGQSIRILHVIVEDRHLMPRQRGEAR